MTAGRSLPPARAVGTNMSEYTLTGGVSFVVSNRYELSKQVGHGAYGYVCSGVDTKTGERVAIKKIPRLFNDIVDGKRILREIKLLSFLKHENIISIKDIIQPSDPKSFEDIYYVTELMDTDLHQIIRSDQALTEEHYRYFIYQALRALKYIHSANVLHRDLKPGNLLVNGNCDLLVCDFGLARGYEPENELTDYVVTRWYRPPELLLLAHHYTPAVDVWSTGCILAELVIRKPLFAGKDYIHQLNLITDILGVPEDEDTHFITTSEALSYIKALRRKPPVPLRDVIPEASEDCLDLLQKMLAFNPAKRISAEEALTHPFLRELHDPHDEPSSADQFYWDRDSQTITAEELREGLWEEMQKY